MQAFDAPLEIAAGHAHVLLAVAAWVASFGAGASYRGDHEVALREAADLGARGRHPAQVLVAYDEVVAALGSHADAPGVQVRVGAADASFHNVDEHLVGAVQARGRHVHYTQAVALAGCDDGGPH
jgi:hypothetical protein